MRVLFFIITSSFLLSSGMLVDTIIISGNNKTKAYIIKRELLQPINAPLDSTIMNQDINRLYNLGIFSTVDINFEDNSYNVNLVESFSIIPDLIIDYSEISNKWSYGLGLAHINFLGLDQELYLGASFIGEKSFAISLNNPWIYGDHISLRTTIYKRFADNPFYNFRYNEFHAYFQLGFYKGIYNKFKNTISYYSNIIDEYTIPEGMYDFVSSKPLESRYIRIICDYKHDTRDIYKDPLNGHLFQLKVKYSKDLMHTLDITELILSFNKYHHLKYFPFNKLHEPVISYRISSLFKSLEFDALPIHEYEYLGGEDYVRGYSSLPDNYPNQSFDSKIKVANIIYSHIELQNTILKKKDYGKIEFGIDGVLFVNAGLGSQNLDNFNLDNMLVGYGFGFRFFITGPPVPIGLMFGFNPYGQNHMHLNN